MIFCWCPNLRSPGLPSPPWRVSSCLGGVGVLLFHSVRPEPDKLSVWRAAFKLNGPNQSIRDALIDFSSLQRAKRQET